MLDTIPREIFQTWKSHKIPEPCKDWVASWKIHNPEYDYTLFDDKENRIFIEKEFPWFLEKYDSYSKEIYRADLARYFYLYKYGGIYADIDFECMRPFEPLIHELEKKAGIIFGRMGAEETCFNVPNALIISAPNEFFWMLLVSIIIDDNLDDEVYGPDIITGPNAVKKALYYYTMRKQLLRGYSLSDIDSYNFKYKEDIIRLRYYLMESRRSPVYILNHRVFYKINWKDIIKDPTTMRNDLIKCYKLLKDKNRIDKDIYAITYWMASWKEKGRLEL